MEFKKDTIIKDVLENHKQAEEILTSFGLHCLYCPCSQAESLEEACQVHGLDVETLVNKLNEKPKKKCCKKKD